MLKTSETYRVTVVLNDGQARVCTLLSKPDAATLAAVASAQKATAELIEAAAIARNLVIPTLGEDAVKTPIIVAGTQIGAVHIETESAFVWQARKPRKPKPAEATEQATTSRQKRKRKPKPAETTEPVTEPVTETTEPVTA